MTMKAMPEFAQELYYQCLVRGFRITIISGQKWFCNWPERMFGYGHSCDDLLIKYGLWNNAKGG